MRIKIDKMEAPQEVNGGEMKLTLRVDKKTVDALIEQGIDPFMDAFKLSRHQGDIFLTNEGVDTPEQPKTPYRALQSLGVQVDNVGNSLQMLADAMAKVGEITQDEAEGLFTVEIGGTINGIEGEILCQQCKRDKITPRDCIVRNCVSSTIYPVVPDNVENIVLEEEICSHAEMANDGIYNCALRGDMCPCVAKSSDEICFLNQERGG
jgi:hypothetical protein